MSTPSLLNIPYRLKAGTLYSQLPETGAGDFTVSRTTTVANQSTRINSLGNIELVADNVPRLDYPVGGAVNGCPALLVEPSAQNLALQSADFNTTWLAQNSATVNTNTAISPDGTQNADTINLAAVNDSRVRQTITVANSTTYTISCFYKNIALTAGQTFRMRFNNAASSPNNFIATATIDLAAGAATYSLIGTSGTGFSGTATGRVDNYGNGWYRVSLTFTVGTGGGAAGIFEAASVDPGAVRSFYAWGAQLEASSVPTSYIPTTTGPVTRGAETISKTGVSSLIGQTEGTIYLEVDAENASSQFFRINIATSNAIHIYKNASDRYGVAIYTSTGPSSVFLTDTSAKSGFVKIAIAYKSGESALVINGGSPITSPTAYSFSAALNTINFLGGVEPVRPTRIRAVELYPNRLTNAQLATLTAL